MTTDPRIVTAARAEDDASCVEGCGATAEKAFHVCREAGGDLDCVATAVDAYQTCVEQSCPTPPTCEERCAELPGDYAAVSDYVAVHAVPRG